MEALESICQSYVSLAAVVPGEPHTLRRLVWFCLSLGKLCHKEVICGRSDVDTSTLLACQSYATHFLIRLVLVVIVGGWRWGFISVVCCFAASEKPRVCVDTLRSYVFVLHVERCN